MNAVEWRGQRSTGWRESTREEGREKERKVLFAYAGERTRSDVLEKEK